MRRDLLALQEFPALKRQAIFTAFLRDRTYIRTHMRSRTIPRFLPDKLSPKISADKDGKEKSLSASIFGESRPVQAPDALGWRACRRLQDGPAVAGADWEVLGSPRYAAAPDDNAFWILHRDDGISHS
jgi:hypothetical protein